MRNGGLVQRLSRGRSLAVLAAFAVVMPGMLVAPGAQAQDVGQSQVTLSKTASPASIEPGQEVTYTFDLSCSGLTTDCIAPVLTDVIPPGLEVVSIPQSSSERDVVYDEATRTLTASYIIPLASPPNPPGSVGLPAGATRKLQVSLRLPLETDLTPGTLTNNATFVGTNTNTATDSADIEITIPRITRPVATKDWNPSSAIAQSGDESTITLGARNASSTSAEVTEVSVTDLDVDTFDRFDVTQLGPVTRYPAGADQVEVFVCTKVGTPTCTDAELVSAGIQSGTGPLNPPPGVPLDSITGVRYVFSNSGGADLPFDATGGTVEIGVVLRDDLRSTGNPIQPPSRETVTNTVTPALVDRVDGPQTGQNVSDSFSINPNILKASTNKRQFCSDTNLDFGCDGTAVAGQNSGVSIDIRGKSTSGFNVASMEIIDPDPSVPASQNVFQIVDVTKIRIEPPAGSQRSTITVTCRGGTTGVLTFEDRVSHTVNVNPDLCPDGDFPLSVSVKYEGTTASGDGAIVNNSEGKLKIAGTLNDSATAGRYDNCAVTNLTNPVNSSGAGTANNCATLTVQAPQVPGVGDGVKGTGQVTTITPGQPLTFNLQFKNTSNLPVTNVVLVDPVNPDPADPNNPYDIVRLTEITKITTNPTSELEVYDPTVSNYVAYNANDAALLERATGIRVRVTGNLAANATFKIAYSVVLRDDVPADGSLTFQNCAAVGVGAPDTNDPFCNNNDITAEPGSTAGEVQKSFAPSTVDRPFVGQPPADIQQSTLRLRIRNSGTLNLNKLILTDVDRDFWDAYDFVGDVRVNLPPGADRLRLDVCTSLDDCDNGTFVNGNLTTDTTPPLPGGVSASQVRGFRVTFTRNDGAYLLTPSTTFVNANRCNQQSVCVQVRPRATLLSTGAPVPDTSENTVSAEGRSLQQDQTNPDATFPIGESPSTINLRDGARSLDIDKDPDSRIAPGEQAPFTLVVENTGEAGITDLAVRDPIPDQLNVVLDLPGGAAGQPYTISYELPAGTPEPPTVDFDITAQTIGTPPNTTQRVSQLDWKFPGWTFLPGSKVTITFNVELAPGTPADVEIRNTAGATSTTPGAEFDCTPDGNDDGQILPGTDFGTPTPNDNKWCTSYADIRSLEGTAFSASKWVAGRDDLGFRNSLTGVITPTTDPACPQFINGGRLYTRYPCVALNYPGQGFDFLLRLTNISNNAITESIRIVDTLPVKGDRGIILNTQQRETEWDSPARLLTAPREISGYSFNNSVRYTTFDTVAEDICFELISIPPGIPGGVQPPGCVNADWTAQFPADRDSITAVDGVLNFTLRSGLLPGQSALVTARVDSPLTQTNPSAFPTAWNSFAHEDLLFREGTGTKVVLPATEPIKAGIAVVFGKVAVTKEVTTPPPGIDLGTFPISYECTATRENPEGGQDPPVIVAQGTLQVAGGVTVEVPDVLPAGAECLFWEDDTNGGVSPNEGRDNAVSVTVEPSETVNGPQPPQQVTISNDFPTSELVIRKGVTGTGVGLPLEPDGAWGDGPFTVNVDCVFPASGSSLTGYPQDLTLEPEQEVTLTDLPIGAVCTITETGKGGATSTSVRVNDGGLPDFGQGDDSDSANIPENGAGALVVNTFATGELLIRKEITGDGADFADRDFVFTVDCGLPGLDFEQVTATIDRPGQSEVVVPNLPANATCVVREIDDGGAAGDNPPPGKVVGTVVIEEGETPEVEVTATNEFPAAFLMLSKVLDGPGAGEAVDTDFTIDVFCQRELPDGSTGPVPGYNPATTTLKGGEMVTLTDPIPVGASCWAEETGTGGATQVTIDFDAPDNAIEVTEENLANIAITATNFFDVGSLVIEKSVQGPGAQFADQPFTFQVTCDFQGAEVYDQTVTITPPDRQATIAGLPTGAECTVVELPPFGGADGAATLAPTGPYEVGSGTPVTVIATNTFSVGSLTLTKDVVNEGIDETLLPPSLDLVYEVEVTCQRELVDGSFTDLDGYPQTVLLRDGELVTVDSQLPIGARCWAVETDTQGATEVDVDFDSPQNAAIVELPLQPGGDPPRISITATNTYRPGGLVITKQVEGPGAGAADRPFVFDVQCTVGGITLNPFDLTITPPATSAGRDGLPPNSECTITERPPFGGADGPAAITPNPVTVPPYDEDAEGNLAPAPVEVTAVNTFSVGELTISKVVDGPAASVAADIEFDIQVTCTRPGPDGADVPVLDQTVTLKGGESQTIGGLPIGSVCSAVETTTGGATETVVSPDEVEITLTPPEGGFEITATNTYNEGPLRIVKVLDPPDYPYADRPFDFSVECTFEGRQLPTRFLTVFPPDTSAVLNNLPTGAECQINERPPFGGADGPAQVVPTSVTIGDGQDALVSFTATNTFTLGELTLRKVVDGDGASFVPADTEFTLQVTCERDGPNGRVQFVDQQVTLTPGEETSLGVPLPIGATCTTTEVDAQGATMSSVAPSPVDITLETPTVEVTATNTYDVGYLRLEKTLTGDGAAFVPDGTLFDLEVSCGFLGQPVAGFSPAQVTLTAPDLTTSVGPLPDGAVCDVTEPDPAASGSQGVTITGTPTDPPVTISPSSESEPAVSVTVDNFYDVGSFEITKVVEGPGAEFADRPFVFDVTCTFLGSPVDGFNPGTATITPPATTATIDGVPVGAECSVAEAPPFGGADGPAVIDPPSVTIPPPGEDAEVAAITATNTFSAGDLTLTKKVTGAGAGFAADREFVIDVFCVREGPDGEEQFLAETATLSVDSPTATYGPLPIGAECWAQETDTGGATNATVDFDNRDNAVEVTLDTPAIAITATNEFVTGRLEVNKTVVNGPAGAGPFTFEVVCEQPTDAGSLPVELPDGGTLTVAGGATGTLEVPYGSVCTVTETSVPDGVTVTLIDNDPSTDGGPDDGVVVVDGQSSIGIVSVTNTYPVPPKPPVTPPTQPPTMPPTGADGLGPIVATAATLVLSGAALVTWALWRRRRVAG